MHVALLPQCAQQLFQENGACVCSKTVEVLALVLANPAPTAIVSGTNVKVKSGETYMQSRGTLVICKVRAHQLHQLHSTRAACFAPVGYGAARAC